MNTVETAPEDHPPSVILDANLQNGNQKLVTAELHSAPITLDLPIMVNEGTEIVSLPVCLQHENEAQEAIAMTDLSAVALQEVEETDIGFPSEYWNMDVEAMSLCKVETPVNTKKKVGLSSSRILTSTEVIQAKKDMAELKEKKAQAAQERKARAEERKLKAQEKKNSKSYKK